MDRLAFALIAGAVFGVGMSHSDMVNPARVLGFFDVLGAWDPTLAFVMAGGMIPMAAAWFIRRRMARSVLGAELPGPPSKVIDAKLIGGAAVFGVGWGVSGLCPGAVVPAMAYGGWPILLFFVSMGLGLFLARTALTRRFVANA